MTTLTIEQFLLNELTGTQTIAFKPIYCDMADGDIHAGLLLSQIVYWHMPSKETGRTKLRVKKEGNLWIAKGREDWFEEIRLKPKQFDKAVKILENNNLVEKKLFKFNGNPTTHIRIIWDVFLEQYSEKMYSQPLSDMVFPKSGKTNSPNWEEPIPQIGNNDIAKLGKTLTENTTKNNNIENNIDKPLPLPNVDDRKKEEVGTIENQIKVKVDQFLQDLYLSDIPNQIKHFMKSNAKKLIRMNFNVVEFERFCNSYSCYQESADFEKVEYINAKELYFITQQLVENVDHIEKTTFGLVKNWCNRYLSYKREYVLDNLESQVANEEISEQVIVDGFGRAIFYNWLED